MDQLAEADTFPLGRTTYQLLSTAWSGATGDYMEMIHAIPKLVASNTLHGPLGWNATVLSGDVVKEVAELKQRPGKDIVVYGSGRLVRALLRHKLIDSFKISIFPLVLGSGARLFPESHEGSEGFARTDLHLEETKTLRSGVVALTYRS
jgi:dihydrofolate reductase